MSHTTITPEEVKALSVRAKAIEMYEDRRITAWQAPDGTVYTVRAQRTAPHGIGLVRRWWPDCSEFFRVRHDGTFYQTDDVTAWTKGNILELSPCER